MPRSPEIQYPRLALPIALVTLLIGFLLWIAGLFSLPSTVPTVVAVPVAARAPTTHAWGVGTAVPLPTIAASQTIGPISRAPTSALVPMMTPQLISAARDGGATTAAPTADATLTARLAHHLSCLAPHARHNVALEAHAAELAVQDISPLPATGAIQIADLHGQRILLGADALAALRAADGRCGETLIFGVPPLTWLPADARFGLAAATHPNGAVVVVVTR